MSLNRYMHLKRVLEPNKLYLAVNYHRYKSTEVAEGSKNADTFIDFPKSFEKPLDIRPRVLNRKPKVKPFAKSLFLSEVDVSLLAYPELVKDDLLNLDEKLDAIDNIIGDLTAADETILETCKRERLFTAPLTVFQGGLDSTYTERMRFLEELSRLRAKVAIQLNTQWAGIDTLKFSFSEGTMNTLGGKLYDGKYPIRMLCKERMSEEIDAPDLRLLAKTTPSGEWLLNGEKLISKTLDSQPYNEYLIVVSCQHTNCLQGFLVHPNAPGVTYKDSSITFSDTPGLMLGEDMAKLFLDLMEKNQKVLPPPSPVHKGMTHVRLGESAIILGILRDALPFVINLMKKKYFMNKPFYENPMFESLVTDAATVIYKLESMIYLTTGLQDGYMDPDIELEALLCRIYAVKEGNRIMNRFIDELCPFGVSVEDLESNLKNMKSITQSEHNGNLCVYSTALGLAYAGFQMTENVVKMRNPAFHPMYVLKKMFGERRQQNDNPVLTLALKEHLHPSLIDASDLVEYCVMRISFVVESAFIHHGQNILEEYRDMERINEIVIETFAALASLSRASRAYCIGVRNANREILLSQMIATKTRHLVKSKATQLADGKYLNFDDTVQNVGHDALTQGRHPMDHPLTRVFL